MRFKVLHTRCGEQVGWYEGGEFEQMGSAGFTDMAGEAPMPLSLIRIKCETCGMTICSLMQLMRISEETHDV